MSQAGGMTAEEALRHFEALKADIERLRIAERQCGRLEALEEAAKVAEANLDGGWDALIPRDIRALKHKQP
jgi:hypothetical protein